jgi:predicted permease
MSHQSTPLWRRYLRFWGADPGADVDDEFAFHLEMRTEQLVDAGYSPAEARAEALRGFGDIQQTRKVCTMLAEDREREIRRTQWWSDWQFDVRLALRQMKARPATTAIIALTIALGIGATVSIFSVLHAVVLRPLPFAGSDRIVFVYETWRQFQNGNASAGHFHDWTAQGTVFEDTAAQRRATYNLADGGEPERVLGAMVTPGYFRVLHIPPVAGRYFTEPELAQGTRIAVLGHGLWLRRFGADPSIVGREIRLNGEAHTVVGIASPQYAVSAFTPEVWTPLVFSAEQRANYGSHVYPVLAKLKPGITKQAAQAELERVTRRIAEAHPREMVGRGARVQSYEDVLLSAVRTPLFVVFAAVVFVLLIGCVNVANLLLARATVRRREIAIRAAIGGGRWRIIRQLLTESVIFALMGGTAGVALALAGTRLFVAFGPANVPRLNEAGLRVEVLLFALAVTLVTGIVFGLVPALHAAREDVAATLRDGGRTAARAGGEWLRTTLVVSEIAVTIVLLVAAGLVVRSAWRLGEVSLGFDLSRAFTASVALPERYASPEAVTDAFRRMVEQLRSTPGVEKAGASSAIPLVSGAPTAGIMIEGRTISPESMPSPALRLITDDYVEAIGMRLVRGRTLTADDMAVGAVPAVLINEQLVRVAWPGDDPIGKRLRLDTGGWYEVVGVLADVHSGGPDTPVGPELFLPYTKPPFGPVRSMALVVRTATGPASLGPAVRRAVRTVDSSLPLFDVLTMNTALAREMAGARFSAWLLSLLAVTGLVLAAIGIYGVIGYFVTQRTGEIGVRLALGATRLSVLLMVLRHTAKLAAAGIVVGIFLALAATRVLESLLFEVPVTDPPTYVVGTAALLATALLACAVPLLRALRVSPMASLAGSQ